MRIEIEIEEVDGIPAQDLEYFTEEIQELFDNFGWEVTWTSWKDLETE